MVSVVEAGGVCGRHAAGEVRAERDGERGTDGTTWPRTTELQTRAH